MPTTESPRIVNRTLDYAVDTDGRFYKGRMEAEEIEGSFHWRRIYDQSVRQEDVPERDLRALRLLTVDVRTVQGQRIVETVDYNNWPVAVYRNSPDGVVVTAPERGPWKGIQPTTQADVHPAIQALLSGQDPKEVLSQHQDLVKHRSIFTEPL